VLVEPRNQRVELRRVERELAAPARVRSHELLVHPAHRHAELLRRALTEIPRLLGGVLVEVYVSVIAGVQVRRSLGHRTLSR
jgi:hypothetical protein